MSAATPAAPAPRAPSITDVAARAQVSIQTVSRVLNDNPRVAPDTRERVLRAIDGLGYRRNAAARTLATGRAAGLGVLTPSSALYGPASMTAALGLAAAEAGVHLVVEHVVEFDSDSVRRGMQRLADQQVAGVAIVCPVQEGVVSLTATDPAVPVVTVDGQVGPTVPDVSVDQRAGAQLAVEHLLGLGHRTVWHVAGPAGWHDAAARCAGWRDALLAAGREVPPVLDGDWSAGSGHRAGEVLARVPECTAVLTANDAQALGLVRALAERGRRVPDDVSVVGFDDTPESAYFLPPLTTVRQEFAELGRSALQVLQSLVASPPAPGAQVPRELSVHLPPALVVRASTGPPPSS